MEKTERALNNSRCESMKAASYTILRLNNSGMIQKKKKRAISKYCAPGFSFIFWEAGVAAQNLLAEDCRAENRLRDHSLIADSTIVDIFRLPDHAEP